MATMAVDPMLVDTNVLVSANTATAPLHAEAQAALLSFSTSGSELWISRQILREEIEGWELHRPIRRMRVPAVLRQAALGRAIPGVAYVAWLLLGWHYLYLGRVGLQFAFWFTAGGFLLRWLLDLIRPPGVVARHNEDVARELMARYCMMA